MKFNQILNIFIQDNAFKNANCKMRDILFRPQWVKTYYGFIEFQNAVARWLCDI